MDKIIDYHTEKRMFVGRKPNSIPDSYKKLAIMMGTAPKSFAGKGMAVSKTGPRGLGKSTTVSKFFREHYIKGVSLDLSVDNVSQLLNDLSQSELTQHSKREPRGSLKRKWQATKTLSPLQLLAAL